MGALVLLPPLPPEPAVVRRAGQQCFGFLGITVVVRAAVPRRRRPAAPPKPIQLAAEDWRLWSRYRGGRARTHALKVINDAQDQERFRLPKRLTLHERAEMARVMNDLIAAGQYHRPQHGNGVDGDCQPGPCPWVSCRHHLKLEVDPVTGAIRDNFPGLDVDQMGETCSLRAAIAATEDGLTQGEVGALMNMSWMRVSQVEAEASKVMRRGLKKQR